MKNKTFNLQVIISIASLFFYINYFGLLKGISIALIILTHEFGHLLAAKKLKIKTNGLFLFPFGGIAVMEEPLYKKDSITVLLSGSLLGSVIILPFLLIFFFTKNALFLEITSWTLLLNGFNLLPIVSLDGGKVFRHAIKSFGKLPSLLFILISAMFTTFFAVSVSSIIAGGYSIILFILVGISFYWLSKEVINYYEYKVNKNDFYDYSYSSDLLSKKRSFVTMLGCITASIFMITSGIYLLKGLNG